MPQLRLVDWISARSGLAHRSQVLAGGYSDHAMKSAVRFGELRRLPRGWLGAVRLDPDLEIAARGRAANALRGADHGSQMGGVRAAYPVVTLTLDWLAEHQPAPDLIKCDAEGEMRSSNLAI